MFNGSKREVVSARVGRAPCLAEPACSLSRASPAQLQGTPRGSLELGDMAAGAGLRGGGDGGVASMPAYTLDYAGNYWAGERRLHHLPLAASYCDVRTPVRNLCRFHKRIILYVVLQRGKPLLECSAAVHRYLTIAGADLRPCWPPTRVPGACISQSAGY